MKIVMITLLLVGLLSFATFRAFKEKTQVVRREIVGITRLKEEGESRRRADEKVHSKRKLSQFVSPGDHSDSPFVQKAARELFEEFGYTKATTSDALKKLRELRIDEIKLLHFHLSRRHTFTDSHNQYCLLMASDLVLLEADPLSILDNDALREENRDLWGNRASIAFQSLLRKDPKAARRYFKNISLDDLQSNKSPFSKIYTQMMGHLFAHDPEAAIKYFRIQKESIRNHPFVGSRGHLSSMEQVMPYAGLLKSESWTDPSVSELLRWAGREAERLGGLDGLARFSKSWSGSDKSSDEQLDLFFGHISPITNRKNADEFMQFLSREEVSTRGARYNFSKLAQDWSAVDLKGVSRWIEEQPPSSERDEMIESLMRGLDWADPAASERWIPLLHDEILRSRHLKEIDEREAPYRAGND